MSVAGFVLVCALDLIGRSANQLPPIILVDTRPAEASTDAVGFVRPGEPAIYLITSSPPFEAAIHANRAMSGCRDLDAIRLMASIIVHEEWHLKYGTDEEGAYFAQLTEMQRLGAGPGRWPYEAVRRAMVATRDRQSERLRAARQYAALAPRDPLSNRGTPSPPPQSDRPWPRAAQEPSRLPVPPR